MAYDYNKAKADYEALTPDQQKQFVEQNKNDANFQKFAVEYTKEKYGTGSNNQTSTPTSSTTPTTSTSSNVAKPEYQGTGTTIPNSYKNQGEGYYTYNPTSGYYEKQGTSQTSNVDTGDSYKSKVANQWNSLDYAKQQELIKKDPNLRSYLQQAGLVEKSAPTSGTETSAGTGETVKSGTTKTGDGWDYQDNSPERMKQIADNINQIEQSDPYIFNNEDSFRKFFIDGKGRTAEQEAFLLDLYKNRKKYNELNNYTADEIGAMDVNGRVPESYLTYLKNSDPERYAMVMDAIAKEKGKIKDSASLDTISTLSGEDAKTKTSDAIEWLKSQGLFLDKDGNLIDDRTENYASKEEQTYLKALADLAARNLDIDNTVKHTYDDLVEKYPGATKATLMAMAQDINADLLREKENNNVEMTRFQGYVNYMQSERQERDAVGQNAINQLQKQYGMYYSYSPEGMSELAQAQYAATNITLDQADSGTYTQKQMALESVLSPIYEQYGSIIERPMAKAINDIIAYAQNKGVSLSKAFEDNFMKYLKEKPQYAQLSSPEPYTIKVGDVAYQYNFETGEFTPINATIGAGTGLGTMRTERNNNPTAMTTDVAKSLGLVEGKDYVKGDSFKDKNGNILYTAKLLNDPIETTIKALDNGANSSSTHAFYTAGGDQRWSHTAMSDSEWLSKTPEEKQEIVLKMLQREGGDINKMSYYNQGDATPTSDQNSKFGNLAGWNSDGYLDTFAKDYEAYLKSPKDYDKSDIEARYAPLGMSWYDFTAQATNYAKTGMKQSAIGDASKSLESAVALYEYINGDKSGTGWRNRASGLTSLYRGNLMGAIGSIGGNAQDSMWDMVLAYLPKTKQYDAKTYFNSLNARQTLDKLIETKQQGATYGAMSEGEWEMLSNAANLLDWGQSGEEFQKNLEDLIYSLQLAVVEGGGQLPQNYNGSSASNMVIQENAKGRWDKYKYGGSTSGQGAPSEI